MRLQPQSPVLDTAKVASLLYGAGSANLLLVCFFCQLWLAFLLNRFGFGLWWDVTNNRI